MNRFLVFNFLWIVPICAAENIPLRLSEYSVMATVDTRRSEIIGSVSVWIHVAADSVDRMSFSLRTPLSVTAVRDVDDDRYSFQPSPSSSDLTIYSIELPSNRYRNDSFFVKIEFEGMLDTSSYQQSFINAHEFLLLNLPTSAWLPQFGSAEPERTTMQLTVDQSFTVVGPFPHDSLHIREDKALYFYSRSSPGSPTDLFSFCGSTTVEKFRKQSIDSLITISLMITPSRFNGQFADSLLSFLVSAATLYKDFSGNRSPFEQTFVFIGDDNIGGELYRIGNTVIGRNSPALTVYEPEAFQRSVFNPWLLELARSFCLTHADSLALFDDGWAGYLASKFIMARAKDRRIERRERLDLMINAMSFYPSNPLSAGKKNRRNEIEVLSYKGRYIFLMLENILGRESFDTVIRKMYAQFARTPISTADFQKLCEDEYGSPLDWFFRQWLDRSSIPEYVAEWNFQKTQRGVNIVTVSIEQRGEVFSGPLTLYFTFGQRRIPKRVFVDQGKQTFAFPFPTPPGSVELDPDYAVLRWILDIRILAHAKSSRLFRVFDKDVSTSEREAALTLSLDPSNATGSAAIAYFSLGKLAVIERDLEKAKELFLKAMQSTASDEASLYPLLSLVRYANILEMEGNRADAVPLYERAISEGRKNPFLFAPVIVDAEKYLKTPFVSNDEIWFGLY